MTIDVLSDKSLGQTAEQDETVLRPGLAILTMMAMASFCLEIEVLEHLDSFWRYMSYREVALDSGVALLGSLGVAFAWWLLVLLLFKATRLTTRKHAVSLAWSLWLGLPATYLALDLIRAATILFSIERRPRLSTWLLMGSVLAILNIAVLFTANRSRLQKFCHDRLAPLGWLHVILATVTVAVLLIKGVYLFHDYARAPSVAAASDTPDVYLITIDALRADDMSLYGYGLPTTPNLEKFSRRSSTFDYFIADSNFTTSTTVSIETGKLPWSHRVFQPFGFLRSGIAAETVADLLHERGYYTAMIFSNELAGPVQHRTLAGYDAVQYAKPLGAYGNWRYTSLVGTNSAGTLNVSILGHLSLLGWYLDSLISGDRYPFPAERVFEQARALIERRSGKQPLFLWTHILPPHNPYWPPTPFRRRFLPTEKLFSHPDPTNFNVHRLPSGVTAAELRARYDEMIAYADHAVGDFLDYLDQTGRLDNSLVIVSADHGESFEHNWYNHMGPFLYNGLIRIPLLIHLPGQKQGVRVGDVAEQADLLPTILDLVGGSAPARTDGVSLKAALAGSRLPPRYVFSMNLEPNRIFDPITKGTIAILDDEFKYVNYLEHHEEALYHYRSDRTEEHNLIAAEPEVAKRMRDVLSNKMKEVNSDLTVRP